jgi:anthranilate phosphoribosyltransferase
MTAKHGNRASSSLSGSADVLKAIQPIPPNIDAINGSNIAQVYKETNYAFLFAPHFHPGMAFANFVRKELGVRTIFNLMGPLVNPVESAIEARVVGVAYQSLGPVFAEAFKQSGAKKALVVCGEEDMDEISCAGPTNCWRISEHKEASSHTNEHLNGEEKSTQALVKIDTFQLRPSDFGLSTHPLTDVFGRKMPEDNAAKLMSILRNELPQDDPILEFVLMNTAALLVTSGVCEAETSNAVPGKTVTERGPGGGRWKEGVRRARWAIESGQALKCLERFIEVTNRLG